jgi:hypothetical protein
VDVALFAELKRRRLFRALVGYGIAAFAVLQIIEPIMHGLHWPDVVLSYVVVALAAGFPVVVALAWIFDCANLHGFDHRCRDLVLHREHARQLALEGLRPDMVAVRGGNELRGECWLAPKKRWRSIPSYPPAISRAAR